MVKPQRTLRIISLLWQIFFCPHGFLSGAHVLGNFQTSLFLISEELGFNFLLKRDSLCFEFSARLPVDILPVLILRHILCLGSFQLVIIPNYVPSPLPASLWRLVVYTGSLILDLVL